MKQGDVVVIERTGRTMSVKHLQESARDCKTIAFKAFKFPKSDSKSSVIQIKSFRCACTC
jgi:hypothetical protein